MDEREKIISIVLDIIRNEKQENIKKNLDIYQENMNNLIEIEKYKLINENKLKNKLLTNKERKELKQVISKGKKIVKNLSNTELSVYNEIYNEFNYGIKDFKKFYEIYVSYK